VAVKPHQQLMTAAVERDGEGQRALLAGDAGAARAAFRQAAELYRESWEAAPPRSYGRLVGMLKSAVLAGDARREAEYVRAALGEQQAGDSATAAYALAIAALIEGDDEAAIGWSARMRDGSEAFGRTADAIAAAASRDRAAYSLALGAIVHDFEQRPNHLTGVPIADTAAMLERLAGARGIESGMSSPVLPAGAA